MTGVGASRIRVERTPNLKEVPGTEGGLPSLHGVQIDHYTILEAMTGTDIEKAIDSDASDAQESRTCGRPSGWGLCSQTSKCATWWEHTLPLADIHTRGSTRHGSTQPLNLNHDLDTNQP